MMRGRAYGTQRMLDIFVARYSAVRRRYRPENLRSRLFENALALAFGQIAHMFAHSAQIAPNGALLLVRKSHASSAVRESIPHAEKRDQIREKTALRNETEPHQGRKRPVGLRLK